MQKLSELMQVLFVIIILVGSSCSVEMSDYDLKIILTESMHKVNGKKINSVKLSKEEGKILFYQKDYNDDYSNILLGVTFTEAGIIEKNVRKTTEMGKRKS